MKKGFDDINNKLLDEKKAITLISNYIFQNFNNTESEINAITNLKKLEVFLEKNDFIYDLYFFIELIKENYILANTIKLLVDKNYDRIIKQDLDNIFNNPFITLAVSSYCIINGIKFNQFEIKDDDIFISDSKKAYLNEIKNIPLLSIEEEKEIIAKVKNGDEKARKKLIESNLKLVISIAKRYSMCNIPFLDIVQEGNVGLLIASSRFDPNKGCKFSTYAVYWIEQSILKAIMGKNGIIHIPVYMQSKLIKYKKITKDLENRLNKNPTLEEISMEMNIPIDEVNELYYLSQNVLSTNEIVGEDKIELENFIPSEEENIDDLIIKSSLKEELDKIISKIELSPRDRDIFLSYFRNDTLTFEEIGKKYGITRERVRQIIAKTLKKIRKSNGIASLIEYASNPNLAMQNINKYRQYYSLDIYSHKTFLTSDKRSQVSDAKKEIKTIYQLLYQYSKENINKVIASLSIDDKKLLKKRYGNNLENPISKTLTNYELNAFYTSLIPRMRRKLEKMQTIKKNVDEEDYQAAIKLIKSMNFSRLLSYFNEEELVILLLRFGFINENYFSTESISNYFRISTDEVLDIVKRLSSLSRKDTENLSLTGGKDLIYDILLSGTSKIKELKP